MNFFLSILKQKWNIWKFPLIVPHIWFTFFFSYMYIYRLTITSSIMFGEWLCYVRELPLQYVNMTFSLLWLSESIFTFVVVISNFHFFFRSPFQIVNFPISFLSFRKFTLSTRQLKFTGLSWCICARMVLWLCGLNFKFIDLERHATCNVLPFRQFSWI